MADSEEKSPEGGAAGGKVVIQFTAAFDREVLEHFGGDLDTIMKRKEGITVGSVAAAVLQQHDPADGYVNARVLFPAERPRRSASEEE